MNHKENEAMTVNLSVTDGLSVAVLPFPDHEFLMVTNEVSNGYGTSSYSIRKAFARNNTEFIEGKHFIKGVDIVSNPLRLAMQVQPHQVFWTKRGIVRLGFFIKSKRARLFRDWAEDLILSKIEPVRGHLSPLTRGTRSGVTEGVKQLPEKRSRANRLTPQRMVGIMADVCRIEDYEVRMSLVNKLTGGQA